MYLLKVSVMPKNVDLCNTYIWDHAIIGNFGFYPFNKDRNLIDQVVTCGNPVTCTIDLYINLLDPSFPICNNQYWKNQVTSKTPSVSHWSIFEGVSNIDQ